MNKKEYLTETELAELVQVSVKKLQKDRYHSKGVPFIKFGRLVRYERVQVLAYLESLRENSITGGAA